MNLRVEQSQWFTKTVPHSCGAINLSLEQLREDVARDLVKTDLNNSKRPGGKKMSEKREASASTTEITPPLSSGDVLSQGKMTNTRRDHNEK